MIYPIFGESMSDSCHGGTLNWGRNVCKQKLKEHHLPPHSSKINSNYDRLTEHFHSTLFIVVHLYDYRILYEFLCYNNLYSFIFQPAYSSSGMQVAGAYHGSSEHKAGTSLGQDAIPLQDALTHTPTLTQTETI